MLISFLPSMAATPITPLLMFIGMAICVSAQKHNITLGSTLTTSKNPKWVSPNGQFAFGFYNISPAVYGLGVWFENIPPKTLAWTAMKDKRGITVEEGSTLQLTDIGLNLYDSQKNLQWSAAPSGKVAASALLDSGNFVLFNAVFQPIWQSFDYPTDTLLPGQTLKWDSTMYSKASTTDFSEGRFQLSMQGDGNLVLYPVGRVETPYSAYWYTYQFSGNGYTYEPGVNNLKYILNFDPSGAVYLVNSTTNITVYTITEGVAGGGQFLRRVTLDIYGILGQYVWILNGTDEATAWRSGNDYCKDVNGQCGMNGICRLTSDNMPDCFCPPQFDFIDNEDQFKGCLPKSSPGQKCTASSNMSLLTNTGWLDGSDYSGFSGLSESECKQVCMEDCMCIVVTYADAVCMKKQLPLLDGRQGADITKKAYVKVFDDLQVQPPLPHQQQRKEEGKALVILGISVLAGSSILLAAILLMICFCGYGYKAGVVKEQPKVVEGLTAYSYKEIEAATGGFRHELGRGAFGKVYKGSLPEGRAIAVKALNTMAMEAEGEHAGEMEFRTEMRAIGSSHHKNLVQLYGFCDESSHRLLVYEFMSNESLDRALFADSGFLDWSLRAEIAKGTARGILYLHEECSTQILHCDIKPQNILLDEIYNPKISDFGLAKLLRAEQTRTYTRARGTRGYIAPEWIKITSITMKVDVYSFGVMLLEIVCCRKTLVLDAPENEILLSDWVYECLKQGALHKLVEQQQAEGITIDSRQLERMVLMGLWCIQENPNLRPSMKRVVHMLEGMVDIAVPPPPLSICT